MTEPRKNRATQIEELQKESQKTIVEPVVPVSSPIFTKECIYTIDEIAAVSSMFEATPDVVKTALKLDGKEQYTTNDAKKIIKEFKNKEVKV